MDPRWLGWARRIQALAQNGLAYTEGVFDRERYTELRAIAAQMMAAYADGDPERIEGLFAREEGYATPKVDVRAAVFRGDTLLLVREREDGRWTLPGGWADVGDTPRECVEREVTEESGYRVKATKLLAVYDGSRHGHPPRLHWVYKLFFRCELLDGAPAHSSETDGVEFFSEDRIPPLSLGRATPAQIARLFEHHRNPEWPTDFD